VVGDTWTLEQRNREKQHNAKRSDRGTAFSLLFISSESCSSLKTSPPVLFGSVELYGL